MDLDGVLIMAFDSKKPHEGDQDVCHRTQGMSLTIPPSAGTKRLEVRSPFKKTLGGEYPPPKFNSSPLKNGDWKTSLFLLGR